MKLFETQIFAVAKRNFANSTQQFFSVGFFSRTAKIAPSPVPSYGGPVARSLQLDCWTCLVVLCLLISTISPATASEFILIFDCLDATTPERP